MEELLNAVLEYCGRVCS